MQKEENQKKAQVKGMAGFAIQNPHFMIVSFCFAILLGILCMVLIPKDLLPAGHAPGVQILSFYPGMPVEDIEKEVTFPYERYTGQAVGIRSQDSRSLTGVSIIRNYFQSNIDLSSAIAQTGSLVMSVLRKLPPGSQPPLILPFDPMASQPLALVAISGENKSETELQDLARYSVINSIQNVPGAMAPAVVGGKLRQANILLDNEKLDRLNLSPVRVSEKLQAMNSSIPSGDINIGEFNYQLHSNARFKKLSEVKDFYLRSKNGVSVKLGDVGVVEDGSARQTNVVTINGKKQVYVPIFRQLGANSLEVIEKVKENIKTLESSLSGFKLSIESDQTIFIRKAISAIMIEAIFGGLLAALMIFLFLGSGRATVAVLLTLPVSVIGAIAVLKFSGHTLNVMTLGGLALSIGVLVDNAIVVIEIILAKQREGQSVREASLNGANEVAMPVLASTLATVVVFVPVFFLQGIVETLFTALSISVVAALVISYYASMTMVPLYAYYYLGNFKKSTYSFVTRFQDWFDRVTRYHGNSLNWALGRSARILKWSFFLHFVFGIGLLFLIGSELFPRSDSGSFLVNVRAVTGLRVEMTAELAKKIEQKLREVIPSEDLKMVISNTGVFYGYSAAFTRNAGSQDTTLSVELNENRKHTSQYYVRLLRKALPNEFHNVDFSFELGGLLASALNSGIVSPVDIQITGREYSKSHQVADSLMAKLLKIRGAVDLHVQQRNDSPVMDINIDRKLVSEYGLTPDIVVKNLVSAVSNSTSFNQQLWIDPDTGIDYLLGVQYPENSISTKNQLLAIPVVSADQDRSVALGKFSSISFSEGDSEITHTNLLPTVDIFLDAEGRDIGGVVSDIQDILKKETIPAGYTITIKGEPEAMRSSLGSLGLGFLLAVCLVYFILVVQFRSFIMPALIMTNVPKGLIGVFFIFAITQTYFSIPAAIGCIFVIGVSVSHGVLLLEFILERRNHPGTLETSIIEASQARLRPILMTSLASILGVLPMAIGFGHGAEANIPLGRAVIGGQILSTLLNFYLLPCLYHQIAKRKLNRLESLTIEVRMSS